MTWCVRIGKYDAKSRPLTTIFPVPGRSRTRATASLRRPVVWMRGLLTRVPSCSSRRRSHAARLAALGQRANHGALGLVRVRGSGVHLQLAEHLAAEGALRQHAPDREPHDFLRVAGEQVLETLAANAAGVATVPVIRFLDEL